MLNRPQILNGLVQVQSLLSKSLLDEKDFSYQVFRQLDFHLILSDLLRLPFTPENAEIISKSIFCLSNLVLTSEDMARSILRSPVLASVASLIDTKSPSVLEASYFLLANLLDYDFEILRILEQFGFIECIWEHEDVIFSSWRLSQTVIWFIRNLFDSRQQLQLITKRRLVRAARKCWTSDLKADVALELVLMFKHYLDTSDPDVDFVDKLRIYDELLREFRRGDPDLTKSLLKIYGKLTMGDEQLVSGFFGSEFLKLLYGVFESKDNGLVADALWILSNLCLTSEAVCLACFDDNLVDFLNHNILDMDVINRIKLESLHLIRAFTTSLPADRRRRFVLNSGIFSSILMVINYLSRSCILIALKIFEENLKEFYIQTGKR